MNKACAAAITTIEQQLEVLKESMGLSMKTGEEEGYPEAEPKMKTIGRGRKQKRVPTMAEEEAEGE